MISEHVYDNALVDDLARRLGVPNLFYWLDSEADCLAQLGYVEKRGVWFSPELLHARKISELRRGSTVIGEDASIEVGAHGYVIRYRDDLPRDRMKFSLAHEIGHTYWFDLHNPGKPLSPMQSNASGAATIEHLCDFFAGALLLPRRHLEKIVSQFAGSEIPPLHLIQSLANYFQVADQAVARRLFFQILPQKLAVIKLKKGGNHSIDPRKTGRWRMSWCAVPRELRSAHSVAGLRVPFLTSSRAIPEDMIPTSVGDQAECRMIDGRWWEGLEATNRSESRTSFKSRPSKPGAKAFVCAGRQIRNPSMFEDARDVEYMYLALPL